MRDPELSPPALASNARFNWIFLVELLVCGIITLFFLFYFNRVFGKTISILARLYLRWVGNPHYIDIESLQISILAGRLFFGKVVYHGPNETITIVGGQITWRYWLRRVRHVLSDAISGGEDGTGKSGGLPCRILVEVKGLEWFIYNRSPQYDWVMNEMTAAGEDGHHGDPPVAPRHTDGYGYLNGDDEEDGKQTPKTGSTTLAPRQSRPAAAAVQTFEDVVASSLYLQMLPIKLECTRGAVVMGNNNTPSVLVAHFEKAQGVVDARKSRSIDKYKQVFELCFTHPVVQMKPNENFKEPLLSRGAREQTADTSAQPAAATPTPPTRTRRQKLRDLIPFLTPSVESFAPASTPEDGLANLQSRRGQWMGLSRYLDDAEQQDGWKFEPEEYAMVTDILDCESATFCLYWDVVGTVPTSEPAPREGGKERNGPYPSPQFGIDLSFTSGTINYGPWADRQRVHLQQMFFPRIFKTAVPAEPLRPGDDRAYTEFKIFVELSNSTILRVPVREASKDWKYRRRLEEGEVRPFGWLEVKVGGESTVSYNMSYAPSPSGWAHTLDVEMQKPEVRSSVNHGLLWSAESQSLHCDLSGPLQWNGETKWVFNNVSSGMKVFLLREHVMLLADLATDWTSGPPSEYWTFIPMIYELNLELKDSEFFLNVNDENIINNPSSFDDNTFVVLRNMGGNKGHLRGCITMDFREFRPQSSIVAFTVETVSIEDKGGLLEIGVRTPGWNTWNCSLEQPESLGKVGQIKLNGSYEFYANTAPSLIDTLNLDIDGEGLELVLHGVLIRYFMTIKENYFGDNLHFKTLEEWQEQRIEGVPSASVAPPSKSNDLDVVLSIGARDIVILLPKHIYDSKEHLRLSMPSLGLDMRFTNYYMDLQVDLAPISAFRGGSTSPLPEVFIDGITIFGHRLFGLPPTEPTYVCNWDLTVGDVAGESSLEFLQTAIFAIDSFAFGFKDVENALPGLASLIIHDVTFVRLKVGSIRLWLEMHSSSVFRLAANEVSFVLNDLADEVHSDRITLKIPGLNVAFMDHRSRDEWCTKGYLGTDIDVTVFGRKNNASVARRLQQKHIRESDNRTGRANFLLANDDHESRSSSLLQDLKPVSMALPGLPPPRYDAIGSAYDSSYGGSGMSSRRTGSSMLRSHRSFLSGAGAGASTTSLFRRNSSSHSSAFYSAVESFSDIPMVTPVTRSLNSSGSPSIRPPGSRGSVRASTTTTKSATPTTKSCRPATGTTSRPFGINLSSSFSRPNYPLDNIEPDLSKVPELDAIDGRDLPQTADHSDFPIDEESSRDSIIIEFLPGIRAYCTPAAVKEIANLLEYTQPQSPVDVLDSIQMKVVAKLAEVVKKAKTHGKILETCVRLPQLKFRFADDFALPDHSQDSDERGYTLCLNLRNLLLAGRSKKEVKVEEGHMIEREATSSALSVHVVVDSVNLGLRNLAPPLPGLQNSAQPALGLVVEELRFWASSSDTSTATLQLKTMASSVQGSQALFLYDAAERIAVIGEEIASKFAALSVTKERRVRQFISGLAIAGEDFRITQDPATLTRPSYVLRSATEHVRLNDSWKISTRLRHIWQQLPASEKNKWNAETAKHESQQFNAKDTLIHVLQRWRGWELGNIKESILIKEVFGEDKASAALDAAIHRAVKIGFAIESIKLLLDPGPTADEFVIDQLHGSVVIGTSTNLKNSVGGAAVVVAPSVHANTTVEVHTRSIRLGIRWEVLDILETVAKGLQHRQAQSPKTAVPQSPALSHMTSHSAKPKQRSGGFHLVFTTDHGSVSLDTVNLRVVSMVQAVKASVVLAEKDVDLQVGKFGSVGSLLLNADYGSSEICFGNKILSKATIRAPSLYGHFDEHCLAETIFHIWKMNGSSEEITVNVQEQVLGLLEVVDYVVTDELAHVHRLMSTIEGTKPEDIPPGSPNLGPSKRQVHSIYCSLSLDRFSVTAKLLPSLAYMVRAGGIQLSARPNSKDPTEMIINFGVAHHEHEVCKSVEPSESRIISLLRLPAINVSLRDQHSDEQRFVEATVCVEAITLDASSCQSLLNAFKKPEMIKVLESARLEWQGINSKLEDPEIFGHHEKPKAPGKPVKPLLYRAHAGVSGLKIETLAPSANLEINLGFIQLHASNMGAPKEPALPFPDVRLEFGRITVELTRTTQDGVRDTCGFVEWHASLQTSLQHTVSGQIRPAFYIQSHSLKVDIFAETASAVVDVVGHLQDKLRDLDLSREVKYFKKLRHSKPLVRRSPTLDKDSQFNLSNMAISIEMKGIQVSWIVGDSVIPRNGYQKQNLVLSFKRIHFATATRKSNEAELTIEEFLLQMVDASSNQLTDRSENSALMPEIVFKVAYNISSSERRLAFQAKGRSLDLRLTSSCVMAANSIENSITTAVQKFRDASSSWKSTPTKSGAERTSMFSSKRLASVLVDADFAGAVVQLSRGSADGTTTSGFSGTQQGRYGQFAQGESHGVTMLKSPGLAFKVEYTDPVGEDPSLSAEIKISASDNTLYPSVVPLILEMSDNVKEVMNQAPDAKGMVAKMDKPVKDTPSHDEPSTDVSNPVALLGKCRLNIGIRLCRQEFTLSCQPIARVAASAGYDLIYASINTCDDAEGNRFYSASVAVTGLKMSLQHVYSRDSTGTLEVDAVTLSLMNSKHIVGSAGLSCMMQLSPIKAQANIKQSQDFLLFREIWYPVELRNTSTVPLDYSGEPSPLFAQRYHKVAATNAFPWNATIAVAGIELQLDLGQSLGKTSLLASKLWVTSRKTSDWEQTMCLGFDSIRVSSAGRLGGYIELSGMKVRTSINWDSAIESLDVVQTPLVEASIGFKQFQAKLSFDYQAFLLADIAGFDFLMYNLKDAERGHDRLVGVLDGNEVQIFCTTSSAAQALALYQAFQRLAQDKMASFEASLKEVESFLSRRQTQSHVPSIQGSPELPVRKSSPSSIQSSLFSLHTDVVVNLKEVHVGAFPSTFYDTQIFKLEALNATARFAVETIENRRIHSMLEMTLGQLSVALSPVKHDGQGTTLADISVGRVINGIAAAKQKLGTRGIILKVPQVTAKMHTWHSPGSTKVDYIFKSAFEGQVDVGWNFQRVSFIKGMYHAHVRAFAQRQGKAPMSSRISMYTDLTPGSGASSEHGAGSIASVGSDRGDKKEIEEPDQDKNRKITAVVDVPQSKYEYNPIEPPIIETPQLRDMGEATPPMEWIGLHREKLPHLTHQIVIVSLLEIAREVEDAYAKILGSS